jgi:hypothetical protein
MLTIGYQRDTPTDKYIYSRRITYIMSRHQDIRDMWEMIDKIKSNIDDSLLSSDAEIHEMYITIYGVYEDIFPFTSRRENKG